jgi:hypothetical protein
MKNKQWHKKDKKFVYHKIIIDILKYKKVEFHKYQPRQKCACSLVIRNPHHSVQQELVREVESMGHKIRNLWNIRHRVTGNPFSLFFLDIVEPAANNSEMYHTENRQNMKFQTETPHRKQNNIPQCRKCQAYFHTKGYCAHRPRCVKCDKSHSTEQCTLPKAQPATCLHCGESHPTSYRVCEFYEEIIRTRFSSPWPTASIHITKAPRQESENLAAPQKTEKRLKMS